MVVVVVVVGAMSHRFPVHPELQAHAKGYGSVPGLAIIVPWPLQNTLDALSTSSVPRQPRKPAGSEERREAYPGVEGEVVWYSTR